MTCQPYAPAHHLSHLPAAGAGCLAGPLGRVGQCLAGKRQWHLFCASRAAEAAAAPTSQLRAMRHCGSAVEVSGRMESDNCMLSANSSCYLAVATAHGSFRPAILRSRTMLTCAQSQAEESRNHVGCLHSVFFANLRIRVEVWRSKANRLVESARKLESSLWCCYGRLSALM